MRQASPDFLTDEHVAALAQVDLRGAFVTHGHAARYQRFGEHIDYCYGPREVDYEVMTTLARDLNSDRGDRVAREAFRVGGQAMPGSSSSYLEYIAEQGWDNPLVNIRLSTPIDEALEIARAARAIMPLSYLGGLAIAKDVPGVYADIPETAYKKLQTEYQNQSFWRSLLPRAGKEKRLREAHMVRILGQLAVAMVNARSEDLPADEKQVLAFAAGAGHMRGVTRRLKARGITMTYEQTGVSRELAVMDAFGATALSVLHDIFIGSLLPGTGYRLLRRAKKLRREQERRYG